MINKIKNLINLNNLDGYIVPKNDEFFKININPADPEKFATISSLFIFEYSVKNSSFFGTMYPSRLLILIRFLILFII